jgi:NHL repeat
VKGTLHRGDGPYVAPSPPVTELRFPGKVLALPGGTLLVSDSGHHSLVELAADGETVLRRIGSATRGLVDGPPDGARFSQPQGLLLLPADVRAEVGYDVVVADTVNHALRGLRLDTGEVTTVAGSGRQWMQGSSTADLSSPWDVEWYADRVVVAMAGIHQLWSFDPRTGEVSALAGTSNEGLLDGPAAEAWFAQPSGLAAADDRLWIADSETSAVRYVERDSRDGKDGFVVRTAVGTGLFDFGHRDGPAEQALFQHPLGVTALPDGSVAVSDTYNHALRRFDPASGEVSTLATDLREPSDAVLVDGDIVVVESARHRLTRLRLPEEAVRVASVAHRTQRAATEIAPGTLRLDVVFQAPAGQKLDTRYGPSTRLLVSSTPPELLAGGEGAGTELSRELVLADGVTEGVLHVSAMAASCDDDPVNEYPACHVHQQDWGVPVRVTDGGATRLPLVLAGMDEPS